MSIATKKGDQGMTRLMYNVEISKTHPRVEACGTVDELNAALGLARSLAADSAAINERLNVIQNHLIILMGELATQPNDTARYIKDGFRITEPVMIGYLDDLVSALEDQTQQSESKGGWALPGTSPASAALHLARTVARRAERRVCELHQQHELANPEIIRYLNRLSDVLWLLARCLEMERKAD